MPVRSKRLIGPLAAPTAATVVYTCPAGKTAIFKGLDLGLGPLGSATLSLYIGAFVTANRCHVVTVPNNGWVSETGLFICLEPGEVLRAQASSAGMTMTMYGAELLGVA